MRRDADANGAALRRLWKQWTKVVAGYCRRRRAAPDPVAYGKLHAKLMATCAALAAAAVGTEREFYESLTDVAGPWVSSEVLRRTDGEILANLWQRCRAIDGRLRGLRPRGRTWRIAGLLVPVLLVVLAAAVLALDEALALFGGRARSLALAVWYAVRSLSMGERIVLLGIIVAALGLALLRRNRHN